MLFAWWKHPSQERDEGSEHEFGCLCVSEEQQTQSIGVVYAVESV